MRRPDQLKLSLALLAALSITIVSIVLAANFSPVIPNYIAREAQRHRDINGVSLHNGGYVDAGDEVLVGQLEYADHRNGGVFFIGDSQSRSAIMPWLLPPDEQALIRNYSIGNLGHRQLRLYIKSLVEDFGLLKAGGDKVTIFLGVSHHMTADTDYKSCKFVCHLFQRHGFFTYDGEKGISRMSMSRAERFIRLQRIRAQNFLRILFLSPSDVMAASRADQKPPRQMFSKEWLETVATEGQELIELVDYLQKRNVRVRVIFRPNGSWIESGPDASAYREKIMQLLASRGVPAIDQSKVIRDEDFGDFEHTRYTGQLKIHQIDRRLALDALAESGFKIGK